MTLDVNGSLEFFEGFAQKFYKMEQYMPEVIIDQALK